MSRKVQLRVFLTICLLALGAALWPAARPLGAAPDAFGLTVNVSPAGKGSVNVNPPPPYSNNQVVTLTATPISGWMFDKWVVASDLVWWDNNWDYRVEVTAAAAGYARTNKPAEFELNFTQLWSSLGKTGTLDPNSIRVIEVGAGDAVLDAAVPFQFDRATNYNASTQAAGTLVLIMQGNTPAGASRRYHVYFDVTGKGFTPPNVPAQVTLTQGIVDENQSSYKITTPNGEYFYHTKGGGLSSLVDSNGNDWISYKYNVAGNGGTFRGIPNAVSPNNGGHFHPGGTGMTTTLLNEGPLKVSVHVREKSAPGGRTKWEGVFEFYPNYAMFTMLAAPYNYWFLYEGTPGGQLQTNSDFVVRNTGTQTLTAAAWTGDLETEEWVYFGDPALGRSIYFANHTNDDRNDSYDHQDGIMTKLGFGRTGAGYLLDKALMPREFTFALMNETVFDNAKPIIYNAYKPLTATVGAAQARAGADLGSNNPVNFTITGQHTITAHFKPAQYTLTVNASPADKGSVTKSPNKATYDHNEAVELTAVPVAGWFFAGWSGDLTGTANPATVNVTKNMVITATFTQAFTITTSANPAGGGAVTLNPNKATYAPGEQVQVTAVANSGYSFTNWSGALSGTNPTETVTVNGNLNIVANFSAAQYTFTVTSDGNGSVAWTPQKPLYGEGETVTVTATPNNGYTFVGWTGDVPPADNTDNPLELTITGNTSITAHFIPIVCYTLTTVVSPADSGTVNVEPAPNCEGSGYVSGTAVTLTATPNAQKRFDQWTGSLTGSINPAPVTITGDMTITANFVDDVYPLNVSVVGQGGVAKQPNQPAGYFIDQQVTLTATPAPGWQFVEWSGAATGTSPTTTVTIAGATDITATFAALSEVTLTTSTTGNGTGTIEIAPDQDEYAWGTVVTLTAVPGPDAIFAGWSGDAGGSANPLQVTMDNNKNVVARFIIPAGPRSDNFNSCSLDSLWGAPIDQIGDTTFTNTGTSLRITLPAGSEHAINKNLNNAPRIMQPADDTALDYIVKFDSDVTEKVQTQGILIEAIDGKLMRIDFYANPDQADSVPNDEVVVYAGIWSPGALQKRIQLAIGSADANYLRVTRVGIKWSIFYSATGAADAWQKAGDFNYTMSVTRAGVYAANLKPAGGTAPAFTAEIDFFQNANEGPMVEDTPLLTVNVVGNGSVSPTPPAAQLACGQTVTLQATPGLGWEFSGWSGDVVGTQNPASMVINRPRTVTATFTGANMNYIALPMVIGAP
jgi:uncharacterized repeat protein (TIGR02543 family)